MSGQVYPIKCRIRNEDSGVTRVDVYDDIGGGGWFDEGVTAKSFASQMAKVKGPLEVHVNSGGGEVHDGIAIGNAIRSHKGPVSVVVDGIAASIASVIVQAGQERIMQPGSMMMIHDASTLCWGDEAEMIKTAEVLAKNSDNIASIYADRAGGTPEQWRETMRAETWYTAEEAVSAGLADRVGDGAAELPAGMDVAAFAAVPGRIAARLREMPQAAAPRAAGAPAVTDTGSAPVPDAQDPAPILADAQGACCSACGPDCACGGPPAAHVPLRVAATRSRVLGLESMPPTNEALAVHHTATTDKPWDGPAAVKGMPNDAKVLRYCHAWQDTASDDGTTDDPDGDADDSKASYKFPHHKRQGGPANLAACRNGLARLSGADIPDSDRAGVKAHLQAHLDDGGSDDAGNHAHLDISGIDLEALRMALKGAHE
jgi:ATP-dependent protease ClpP protease subunit